MPELSANKRIAYNVIATYGRSLLVLACGLFSGRWLLMALGEVDYGLYGVVGGLAVFVTFLNGEMANAVGRYYAVAVGEAQKKGATDSGLENCRRWFNTAVMIHSLLPLLLVVIGYPVGDYLVRHFLSIPSERVPACVSVWRCTCVTSYFAMSTVPFVAMYRAKQYIAELTYYSVAQTLLNVGVLFYMVSRPSDWLERYALWMMFLNVTPNLIMSARSLKVFPECKINFGYWWDLRRVKELTCYALLRLWGACAWIVQSQGETILINKFLGAARNAAMTIGGTVASHTTMFASSLSGALTPAIMNAYGANDLRRAETLSYQLCKMGTLMVLVFAIPVALEIDELLRLWLVRPPEYSAPLCLCIMLAILIEQSTDGFSTMIYARGKIFAYQVCIGIDCLLTFGICGLLIWAGMGVVGAGLSLVFMKVFICVVRLVLAVRQGLLSPRYWWRTILLPLVMLVAVTYLIGKLPVLWLPPSFARICLTTVLSEFVFMMMSWCVVMNQDERVFVRKRVLDRFCKRFSISQD